MKVIRFPPYNSYAHRMEVAGKPTHIHNRLGLTNRALLRRIQDGKDLSPAAVLDIGAAVIFHGALETYWGMVNESILDGSVLSKLAEEHSQLADDLEFLETLLDTNPESDDIKSLCLALREHLQTHLERDQRLFYQSLPRLQAVQKLRST